MNDQILQTAQISGDNNTGSQGNTQSDATSGEKTEGEIDRSEEGLRKLQTDPRFDEFLKLYNTHKIDGQVNTIYKNATQCAIRAYGLDKERQYGYARQLGSTLLTKSNILARKIIESKGIGYSEFIEVAAANMLNTENPSWWDRVGEITDWKPKVAQVVQQNNQINVYALDSTEVKDFNKQFLDFLNKE